MDDQSINNTWTDVNAHGVDFYSKFLTVDNAAHCWHGEALETERKLRITYANVKVSYIPSETLAMYTRRQQEQHKLKLKCKSENWSSIRNENWHDRRDTKNDEMVINSTPSVSKYKMF